MHHGPLRAVLRAARRSLHRLRGGGFPVVYHPRYRQSVFGVPLDPLRGEKIQGALAEAGLLRADLVSEPRPASLENLLRVHTPEYLHELQEASALTRILGVEVAPAEAESTLELQRLMAGGTIQATRLALQTGGVAVHLGGGFHHAQPDAGLGFCVFNDVAVAIRRLRARGFAEPVLVVDLDLHDGNGTRRVFASDPTVHTFSIHNDHWGDTEAVESTSIALGAGVDDARFLTALRADAARRCSPRYGRASCFTSPEPTRRQDDAARQLAAQRRGPLGARPAGHEARATRPRAPSRWWSCWPAATARTPGATAPASCSGSPRGRALEPLAEDELALARIPRARPRAAAGRKPWTTGWRSP